MTLILEIVSFIVKHWKLALLVVSLGGTGITGFHLAKSWDRNAALAAEASTLKRRLATITLQQAADAQRASQDKLTLEKLKQAIGETPLNSAACLDRAAVGRVRSIH